MMMMMVVVVMMMMMYPLVRCILWDIKWIWPC